MKRLKYYLKRIKGFQFKNMLNIVEKVSLITKRSKISIFFDIIHCIRKFGCGYMDYFEFEFFLMNDKERSTFLVGAINNEIIKKYNEKSEFFKLSDKITFNNLFKDYLGREFLDLREASLEDFKNFCKGKEKIVGKVLDGTGGKGVSIYKTEKIDKLYNTLKENNQLLVEEVITQHEDISKLYKKSVNTMRIITFLTDKGDVVILNSIFKIGNGGDVDNFSSGGMYTFLDDDGKVLIPAIDEEGNIFEFHPISDERIVDFKIPFYKETKELLKKAAKVVPKIRYIGFDVAISKDGPVIIEGNEFSGIFQMKPSLSGKKEGLLPKYRKYMDI